MSFGTAPTPPQETQANSFHHFPAAAHKKINYTSHCAAENEKLLHAFSLASVICRSEPGKTLRWSIFKVNANSFNLLSLALYVAFNQEGAQVKLQLASKFRPCSNCQPLRLTKFATWPRPKFLFIESSALSALHRTALHSKVNVNVYVNEFQPKAKLNSNILNDKQTAAVHSAQCRPQFSYLVTHRMLLFFWRVTLFVFYIFQLNRNFCNHNQTNVQK